MIFLHSNYRRRVYVRTYQVLTICVLEQKYQYTPVNPCVRVFTLQMEETFVINLADDSEPDSSDVDIDIAGCDFYQNIEKKKEKTTIKEQQQQTNKRDKNE